jgi:hypothetical protein
MSPLKHGFRELIDDWNKPRTALPNLGYFTPLNIRSFRYVLLTLANGMIRVLNEHYADCMVIQARSVRVQHPAG